MTITEDRPSTDVARRAMIDSQLRTSGINEPWLLAAFSRVARENFVPDGLRDAAYIDRAIVLDNGRVLAAPLVHAAILQEARPTLEDKALLIGDGAGYLAALLRPMVGSLDALEPAEASAKGKKGAYSLIVIDGAVEQVPGELAAKLSADGRLVTGLVERGITRVAAGRLAAGDLALLPLAEIGIPVLAEFAAAKGWSF